MKKSKITLTIPGQPGVLLSESDCDLLLKDPTAFAGSASLDVSIEFSSTDMRRLYILGEIDDDQIKAFDLHSSIAGCIYTSRFRENQEIRTIRKLIRTGYNNG